MAQGLTAGSSRLSEWESGTKFKKNEGRGDVVLNEGAIPEPERKG